jgi:hypothetical protein
MHTLIGGRADKIDCSQRAIQASPTRQARLRGLERSYRHPGGTLILAPHTGAERGIADAARGLRVSFLVAVGDEAAGASRFSERLGRRPIATLERVRSWPGEGSAGAAGAQ